MLLQPLLWLDVWALSHSLYARRPKLGKPVDGVRRMALTEADWRAPELKDWTILGNMLARCRRLLRERVADWEIVAAELECLDPGATLPWQPGSDGEVEAHVGVVTNPLARLYAGAEVYSPGWGEVVLSSPNSRAQRSASNSGDTARIHLVLRLRQTSAAIEMET